MRIVLFQPDIPQNTGAILRLAACMGVHVDIVEPCGFVLDDRRMRRAGMDYLDIARYRRHASWAAFQGTRTGAGAQAGEAGRLVLLTTKAEDDYDRFVFRPDDSLILGRESAGVPESVHDAVDARIRIAMAPDARSLNVALAAAMVLGEALRQTGAFPRSEFPRTSSPTSSPTPPPKMEIAEK